MDRTSDRSGGGGARKLRLIIGFAVMAAAVVVLIARANRDNMVYYVTVSELLDRPTLDDRQGGLRVSGRVVPGTIRRQELSLWFEMTDGERAVPVSYQGVVPDTFGEEGEVVVEGHLGGAGTFEASFLMAKCPSKYDAAPGDEQGQHPDAVPISY